MPRKKFEQEIENHPDLWEKAQKKYSVPEAQKKYFKLLLAEQELDRLEEEAAIRAQRKEAEAKLKEKFYRAVLRRIAHGDVVLCVKQGGELVEDPQLDLFLEQARKDLRVYLGRKSVDGGLVIRDRIKYYRSRKGGKR